jgi:hypothetical protein
MTNQTLTPEEHRICNPTETDDILAHRARYGIRAATSEEIELMTDAQKWHYFASGQKPHGVHFDDFTWEGMSVRPLYLMASRNIGLGGKAGNLAALRPLPIAPQ